MPQSGYYQVHRCLIQQSSARLQPPIAHAVGIDVPLAFQGLNGGNEVPRLNQTG